MKRLFLFAAYDKNNAIAPALLYYLKALSALGDVILYMDNAMPQAAELQKITALVKAYGAEKHNEYDFGSYKRAFALAKQHALLDAYDVCYLVNDSVYGPLRNLEPYLERMEALGTDAFGLVFNPNGKKSHLQSWFIGLKRKVFLSNEFAAFLNSVQAEKDKADVCIKYEIGLTALLHKYGFSSKALYDIKGRGIYNKVKKIYDMGLPFVKRDSFVRHNGSLATQISYVLDKCSADAREVIIEDASRLWGKEYIDKLLSTSSLGSMYLYLEYLRSKIFK